jgi:peroxiredoxin
MTGTKSRVATDVAPKVKQPLTLGMLRGRPLWPFSLISLDRCSVPGDYRQGVAVIYFYTGTSSARQQVASEGNAFHASYSQRYDDLLAVSASVIGVSTEPSGLQRQHKIDAGIPHELLSDPDLRIAEELGLPTKDHDGVTVYKRLILVAHDGIIDQIFIR